MKTLPEIADRVKTLDAHRGALESESDVLLRYLPLDMALASLTHTSIPKRTQEAWEHYRLPLEREAIIEAMREFILRVWPPTMSPLERRYGGILGGRNVDRLRGWLWLLGDTVTLLAMEQISQSYQCGPKVEVVCRAYGFPVPGE